MNPTQFKSSTDYYPYSALKTDKRRKLETVPAPEAQENPLRRNIFAELGTDNETSVKVTHVAAVNIGSQQQDDLTSARYTFAETLIDNEKYGEAYDQLILYTQEAPEPWRAYAALGSLLETGWEGYPSDLQKASDYYEKGNGAGCGKCPFHLASLMQDDIIESDEDRQRVLDLYQIAGERGNPDGWFNLGMIHLEGWKGLRSEMDIEPNDAACINLYQAEICFKKAYELDKTDPVVPLTIADTIFHHKIELNQKRADEAMQFLDEAIRLGSHEACYKRGSIYMKGKHFIEKNMELAIKDFEKFEELNACDEYIFVDGLYLLGKLLLIENKENDRLNQLNKAVTILRKAERFCYEWPDWRNTGIRKDVHAELKGIILHSVIARMERAEILLKSSLGKEHMKRKIILCKALKDCQFVTNKNNGTVPLHLIDIYKGILKDLITISIAFAEDLELAELNPDGTPKKSQVKKSVSFSELPPDVHSFQCESEGPLKKIKTQQPINNPRIVFIYEAHDYLKTLNQLFQTEIEYTKQVMLEIGQLALKEVIKMEDLREKLEYLSQIEDLLHKMPECHRTASFKLTLLETYRLFIEVSQKIAETTSDDFKKYFYEKNMSYYQNKYNDLKSKLD